MENIENVTAESSIQELFATHENNFCFECGSNSHEWVSVNNGIFLCTACAGIHKGFGLDISFVRSLTTESLTPGQLEMMKKGGNDKLKEFFERYNISMERPFDVKYRTKAAYYYREKLKALAEGHAVPESPSEEEGPEIIDNSSNFVPIGQTGSQKEKTSILAKAKTYKFNGPQLKDDMAKGLKSIGNSMASGAKSVSTGAKNMATKFNQKMKDSHFKEDAKVFGNKVAVGAKQTAGKIAVGAKQTAGKIAVASKKGYVGAVTYFKGLTTKKNKNQAGEVVNDENVNVQNLGEGSPNTVVEDQKPSISL